MCRVISSGHNLATCFPDVLRLWDYDTNEDGPEFYMPKTGRKAWWLHYTDGGVLHRWRARVCDVVKRNCLQEKSTLGCPYCVGKSVGFGNDLVTTHPYLAEQLSVCRNGFGSESCTQGSHKKVWWWHRTGGGVLHEWRASIYSRALDDKGCPYCKNQLVGYGNDLKSLRPDIAKDWDFDRNDRGPESYVPKSGKAVWWVHTTDEGEIHRWKAIIKNRVSNKSRCPYCSGREPTFVHNLVVLYPVLVYNEWDFERNKKGPEQYTPKSGKKVWWKHFCEKTGEQHRWKAIVCSRTLNSTGCPYCKNGPISKASGCWLDTLGIQNIHGVTREVSLNVGTKFFRVDGFNPETKTVYEFLGNYWHGNPSMFGSDELNKTVGKTFGQLYQGTMERINCLEEAGYKVFYIWEKDFNERF